MRTDVDQVAACSHPDTSRSPANQPPARRPKRSPRHGRILLYGLGDLMVTSIGANRLRQGTFRQADYFDLALITEQYVKVAGEFAARRPA